MKIRCRLCQFEILRIGFFVVAICLAVIFLGAAVITLLGSQPVSAGLLWISPIVAANLLIFWWSTGALLERKCWQNGCRCSCHDFRGAKRCDYNCEYCQGYFPEPLSEKENPSDDSDFCKECQWHHALFSENDNVSEFTDCRCICHNRKKRGR